MLPVSLLLIAAALAQDEWSDQPLIPVAELFREPPEPAEKPAVAWTVSSSRTEISLRGDELRVVQTLRIDPIKPAWVTLQVLDGRVRLEGTPPVTQGPGGSWWYTGYVDKPTTLRLEGTLPVSGSTLRLTVASGVRQTVSTQGEGLDFTVKGASGDILPPSGVLELSWKPKVATQKAITEVIQAESAVATWLEDDALAARAQLRFVVRRGERQQFRVRLPGDVQALNVLGPAVESWDRVGDEIRITARSPVKGVLDLTLEWRVPFRNGQASLSLPEPQDARAEPAWLTLGASSEALLSPAAPGGLRPVAISELPQTAQALGDVQPAAAWSGRGALTVKILRLESIQGPPLVIDKAECLQASADHGRSLLRCRLDVRNDSRQFLKVTPPPGGDLWTARVNGQGVSSVRMASGEIAVPLERSVETLAGLTTLDVELTFVLEDTAWGHKGERTLALPSFDADMAVLRWAVILPPGYEGEQDGGSVQTSDGAVTGPSITYASTSAEVQARDTWNLALDAYQNNDFETAQSWVDTTLSLDPDNENALRLSTNLEVLNAAPAAADPKPAADKAEDEAMSRRVKDMAKSKVAYKEVEQEEAMRRADELLAQGEYEEASKELEKAVELSEDLMRYEQTESVEQAYRSSSSSAKLSEAKKQVEEDRRRSNSRNEEGISGYGMGSSGTTGSGSVGYGSYSAQGAAAPSRRVLVVEEEAILGYPDETDLDQGLGGADSGGAVTYETTGLSASYGAAGEVNPDPMITFDGRSGDFDGEIDRDSDGLLDLDDMVAPSYGEPGAGGEVGDVGSLGALGYVAEPMQVLVEDGQLYTQQGQEREAQVLLQLLTTTGDASGASTGDFLSEVPNGMHSVQVQSPPQDEAYAYFTRIGGASATPQSVDVSANQVSLNNVSTPTPTPSVDAAPDYLDAELLEYEDTAGEEVFISEESRGIGAMLGGIGTQGGGGLGARGSGMGGGGTAEGVGGVGRATTAPAYTVMGDAEVPPPPPAPPPESVVTGRSYQSAVSTVAGVTATRGGRDAGVKNDRVSAGQSEPQTVIMTESTTRAPARGPSPAQAPSAPAAGGRVSLQAPTLASTSLAIPLPEHGERVEVSQRLLAPGEVPTLTLRYRESK